MKTNLLLFFASLCGNPVEFFLEKYEGKDHRSLDNSNGVIQLHSITEEKEGSLVLFENGIDNSSRKIAAPHHESESRRLVAVGDVTVSYDGLFPCDSRDTAFSDLSKNHFYTINLEAGVKYRIETMRDASQCKLDTVGWLYEGVCNSSLGFLSCTEIAVDYNSRSACGPWGDALIEYTPTTSGSFTVCVGNYASYSCPTTNGYNYQVKVTIVSFALNCAAKGQAEVAVTIDPDYCCETSWDIVNAGTTTEVASGGGLTHSGVQTRPFCLPGGDYTFTIYDSYGDGFYYGGFFSVSVNGAEIFKVTDVYYVNNFGSSHTESFTVPTVPTLAPTPNPEQPSPCHNVNCNNAGKCEVTSHTNAKCKCKNTFVNTENLLGCVCREGDTFDKDNNRCIPPVTPSPTASPVKSPTSFPTAAPSTASPTQVVTVKSICEDDKNATFSLMNRDKEVDCAWLTKNSKREKARKANYCGLNHVKMYCKVSCNFCECRDDSTFMFELMNVRDVKKKTQGCSWLLRNADAKEDRIAKYCTETFDGGLVLNACTKSCGQCPLE